MSTVPVAVELEVGTGVAVGRTPRQLFWARFKQDKAAIVGGVAIIVLILLAIFGGPLAVRVTGHPQNEAYFEMTDDFGIPKGPNSSFYFGADAAGRDLFVRVMYGARTSLLVGIVAACSTTKEGCAGGLIKPGLSIVIAVIVLFSWPYVARVVRGNTLSLKEKEFVEASRSIGAGSTRIIGGDVLPNLSAPIIVLATLLVPQSILFEAALSYLGLGVPPDVASWGQILADASGLYDVAWWLMVFPGAFLILTTLAFNLLGDGLRDALDVRTDR